jgi:hypothetical protein
MAGSAEERLMNEDVRLLTRKVNDRIYEAWRSTGSEDGDFLCECGNADCPERVQITLREYAARRAREDEVLARSHSRSAETA